MENKEIIEQLQAICNQPSPIVLSDKQRKAIDLACDKLAHAKTKEQIIEVISLLSPLLVEIGAKIIGK